MSYLKLSLILINFLLTFTLINGIIKKNDNSITKETNEIIHLNITESNFDNLTLLFTNKSDEFFLNEKNLILRTVRTIGIQNTQKSSINNKQLRKNSKYKLKNPKNQVKNNFDNKDTDTENENEESRNDDENRTTNDNNDNKNRLTSNKYKKKENSRKNQLSKNNNDNNNFEADNEQNDQDYKNENDPDTSKTRSNENKKTNSQKKPKQKHNKIDRNDESLKDSGIESIDEDDNEDHSDRQSNLQSNSKNEQNQREKSISSNGIQSKRPIKKKPIKKKVIEKVQLKQYDGHAKLKRPQKGTYGTRKAEKERIFEKFNVKIDGSEFSSEHVFGNKVNLMGASFVHSRQGEVGKAIEATGLAYYEQDSYHKMHVGTFSDKRVPKADDKYLKSGMSPSEYRKFQQTAMREERPGDAIQINLIGYAVLPGFSSSAATHVENNHPSSSNEKNLKGIIANDSFFNMIKQNAPIYRLEGKKVVSQKLTRQEQVELIVARVISTDSARFTAKNGEDPKQVWQTQVNKERIKARAFLDS